MSPRPTHAAELNHAAATPPGPVAPRSAHRDKVVRQLFALHFEFVGRVTRNLGIRGPDVDDVLQQVFSVAAARLEDILPGHERAFLVQTAVRLAANFRRRHARSRELKLERYPDVADSAPSPEELSDQRRAVERLDEVLEAMDLDLRTVFVLYEVEEMTMAQIAELLNLPAGTVASRLRRAREDFKLRLHRGQGEGA